MPADRASSPPAYDDYIYARISEDDIGVERNVTRQLKNCRAKSAAHNGRIIAEFSDNDISALKGAHRPGFQQLMAAITAPNPHRRPRRLVCQHTSRLWRNRSERAHGIDALGKSKIVVLPIDGPQLDLTTAAGRMVAGMLGEVDTGESETKGERIQDAARERAQEGRANGQVNYGWARQYQYDSRGKVVGFDDVVHPAESLIVQEIVTRVLSGESLISVTKDLNARGVPAPRAGERRKLRALGQTADGSLWGKTSVKKIAVRPANIGMRIYHRGLDDEELLPAAWPAIIGFEQHNAVVALLSDPSRRVERPGSRQHLLTWGIGECGICGGHLRVAKKGNAQYGRRSYLYVCDAKGCAGRNEEKVDELVTAVMVRLLSQPRSVELLTDGDSDDADTVQQIRELKARLARAAEDYAAGMIEAGQLRLITARLKPEISALEGRLEASRTNPYAAMAASMIGEGAQERWDALTVTQRRAVLQGFRVQVFIDKAARRGPGFDPESVRIVPRGASRAARGPV